MRALRLAPADDRKRFDTKCKEALGRAEQIKSAAEWRSVARQRPVSKLRPPTSKRKLTTREEIIILEGAKLNGFIFPPWNRQPSPADFVASDSQRFTDAPDLQLSECQREIFAGWKRMSDLLQARQQNTVSEAREPALSAINTTDLVQDVLTDCSVVASLCATTSRSERGLGKVCSCSKTA